MGKVKQVTEKPKNALTGNKISKKKLSKNVPTKLKKIGIKKLLNDSEPKIELNIEENEQFGCILAPPTNNLYDEDQMRSGVKALFDLIEKSPAKKNTLFEDGESIFLQVTCVKVPKTPARQIHLNLTHSLLKKDSEICLIVKDGADVKDVEGTIEHYEKFLKKHGVTNVKCIMPFYQLKTEYGNQFELKRKLSGLYDFFLVDSVVHGYVVSKLGKIFYEKRKMPTAINMKASNFKTHFEKILRKTILKVHSKSDSFSIEVGNTKMMLNEVTDNVLAIAEALDQHFPGGFDNVRSLGIKTNTSLRIPLFLTLKKKNAIKVPIVKAKRPKGFESVTDELTTFTDRTVTVLPTGEVFVRDNSNKKRKRNDDEEDMMLEEESSESEDERKPKTKRTKIKKEKDVKQEDLETTNEVDDVSDKESPSASGDEESNMDEEESDADAEKMLLSFNGEPEEEERNTLKKKKSKYESEGSEEENDFPLAQAEQMYLNFYTKEQSKTKKSAKAQKIQPVEKSKNQKKNVKVSTEKVENKQENYKKGKNNQIKQEKENKKPEPTVKQEKNVNKKADLGNSVVKPVKTNPTDVKIEKINKDGNKKKVMNKSIEQQKTKKEGNKNQKESVQVLKQKKGSVEGKQEKRVPLIKQTKNVAQSKDSKGGDKEGNVDVSNKKKGSGEGKKLKKVTSAKQGENIMSKGNKRLSVKEKEVGSLTKKVRKVK